MAAFQRWGETRARSSGHPAPIAPRSQGRAEAWPERPTGHDDGGHRDGHADGHRRRRTTTTRELASRERSWTRCLRTDSS